ncbi:TPA: restriction endonuclease subunit S [Vibrio parahaemolyticus]|nr:restriction endonuclease subunit S [Vibrio parahaemolyticus]
MNVPTLRFREFDENWNRGFLGDFCTKIQDGNYGAEYPKSDEFIDSGIPFLTSKALGGSGIIDTSKIDYISEEKHSSLKKAQLQLNDVLFTNRGSNVGVISYVDKRIAHGNIGPQLTLLRTNDRITPKFLKTYLQTCLFQKQVAAQDSGSAMNFFGIKATSRFKVNAPSIPEQQKIASFLSKVDEKVALLSEKKDKLTEYKKGVMQQLFNGKWEEQDGQLTFIPPTLRFKADDGSEFPDWEEKTLGQVFTRIRRKNKENNQNVLTISAQQGLINQEKYFNKSVAAKDVTGYYLLENGDFAYNKSYSKGYPMGAIKRLNNYDKGVVSTLYICFGLNKGFVSDFFEHYFESGLQNRDLSKIAQEGARNHGLLNISVDEFFKDVKLLTPSHDEQLKIANFLSAIDQKIDLANSELEKAKEWKKGLLQQMFV